MQLAILGSYLESVLCQDLVDIADSEQECGTKLKHRYNLYQWRNSKSNLFLSLRERLTKWDLHERRECVFEISQNQYRISQEKQWRFRPETFSCQCAEYLAARPIPERVLSDTLAVRWSQRRGCMKAMLLRPAACIQVDYRYVAKARHLG